MSENNSVQEKVQNLFRQLFETPYIKTEDEEGNGFEQTKCPYKVCDGSGYILEIIDGYRKAKNCQCYEDEMLRRKLRNANMSDTYWNKKLTLHNLKGTLLHPLANPVERKEDKRKTVQSEETPGDFIKRCYKEIEMKNGLEAFVREYIKKTLEYLNEEPREKNKNLIFMGEPGRGKTLMASMIGKEYLLNGKKVYFTTMRSLVKNVIDKEVDIEKIVSEIDLLIIDELGYEYHTDSGWAITQIKELLRVRYNKKLPVVCTTNLYPNEVQELYDKSLMSLFNGVYFMVLVDSDGDYRIQEADDALADFESFN